MNVSGPSQHVKGQDREDAAGQLWAYGEDRVHDEANPCVSAACPWINVSRPRLLEEQECGSQEQAAAASRKNVESNFLGQPTREMRGPAEKYQAPETRKHQRPDHGRDPDMTEN